MIDIQRLLDIRKEKHKKFVRQQASIYDKFKKTNWRKPKGMHSKMRRKGIGHRKMPNMGYGAPELVRGLSPEGLKTKLIKNEKDIKSLEKNTGIILSGKLGLKKKIFILEQLKKQGIKVLNINADAFLSSVTKKMEEAKTKRAERLKKKLKKEVKKEREKGKEEVKKEEKKEKVEKKEEKENRQEKTDAEKKEELEGEKRKVLEKPR